jgi:multiple sugar transport system permease protein
MEVNSKTGTSKGRFDIFPFIALVPTLVYLGIFFIYPLILSFYYSFTNISLYNISAFTYVSISNYTSLFKSSVFIQSITITIIFLILSGVVGQMFLGSVLAYMLNGTKKIFATIITLIILMAWATPQVVAGITWYSTVSYIPAGFINFILTSLGGTPIDFLSRSSALYVIILANIWLGLGFSVLLFTSSLKNISPSIIKATIIDGANPFSRFFRVIFPMMKNTILTDLILITLWTLGTFTMIYVLTDGGPANATDLLTIYQYHTAFSLFTIGLANAIGVIIILMGVVMSLLYLRFVRVQG